MSDTKKLLNEIECVRNKMSDIAFEKGFTSQESLKVSQELDNLINFYNRQKEGIG